MSRRRATGFAVLTVLMSFVATLFVGIAPAHATEVDKTIGYRCSSSFGSGASGVRVRVTIPDRVRKGVEVPARTVRFSIRVPANMVAAMRTYGVDSVSAEGRAAYLIGALRRPIRNLQIPETAVPASGGMTLRGTGRAAAFTPEETGTFAVKVTKSLTATATARGGLAGSGTSAALSCAVRQGESRRLATLQVVR
jgi:hypothetical protein